MSDKILDVWRLLWPDGLPVSEFERALMMARLVNVAVPPVAGQITEPDKVLTANDAAEVLGVTGSAVHYMIKVGRLKASKSKGQYTIRLSDPNELAATRGQKRRRRRGGKAQTVVAADGRVSVTAAAKALGRSAQSVRDWIRLGKLPAEKVGKVWMVAGADIQKALHEERSPQ